MNQKDEAHPHIGTWAVLISLLLVIAFVAAHAIPDWYVRFTVIYLLITSGLFFTFAVLTLHDVTYAVSRQGHFLRRMFMPYGLVMMIILVCYLGLNGTVEALRMGDRPESILVSQFFNLGADFVMHIALFGSAVVLGVLAGRHYNHVDSRPIEGPPEPLSDTRLNRLIDSRPRLWKWLALIGMIPALMSVIIVTAKFQGGGSSFGDLLAENITIIQWTSDHEIEFDRSTYYWSDCVGCVPIEHSTEILDTNTGRLAHVKTEDEPFRLGPSSWPQIVSKPLSPDGTKEAYVVDGLDIFMRSTHGLIQIGWPAYINPDKDFFTRNETLLFHLLVAGFALGPLLVFPYAWKHRAEPHMMRNFYLFAAWNSLFFLGSLLPHGFTPFNIYAYFFMPIP